jgi:hypothetical protein
MTPLQVVHTLIAMHYFRLVAPMFPDVDPFDLDPSDWFTEPA